MSDINYCLGAGGFQCMVVSDGYISVPTSLPGSEQNEDEKPSSENMDISCLLVMNGTKKILVDTGCGSGFQDTAGKLLQNLKKTGIDPSEIDTIIYTHGHEDHVGGTFDPSGDPVFPNAGYIVSRKEWECWESKPETPLNEGLFSSARKNLLNIPEKFTLVEDNHEVIPGLKLIPAKGHTPGSVMIQIGSEKEKMLCIGDLIHSQVEFDRPDTYSFLDSFPEDALTLRTEGLAKIADSGNMVYACHFPFPGTGYMVNENGRLGWRPVHGD